MKKVLLLIILCLIVGVPTDAKKVKKTKNANTTATYKVEKAYEVYSNGDKVLEGSELSGNSNIEVKSNGYLMIVNTSAKKRYYISKAMTAKVADVVKEVTKPKSVSKGYLESLINKKRNDRSNSYGNVERKPVFITIDGVEVDKNGEMKVYMIEEE
jgi:hypothetical protein